MTKKRTSDNIKQAARESLKQAIHFIFVAMMFGSLVYLLALVLPQFDIEKARGILLAAPLVVFVAMFIGMYLIKLLSKNDESNEENKILHQDLYFKIGATVIYLIVVIMSFTLF